MKDIFGGIMTSKAIKIISEEHQALSAGISVQNRGQIFALIVSLVILGGSMFLIYSGKEIAIDR